MWYPVFILFVSSLFYIYEFFLRVMPSVITEQLMREFHVGAGLMSTMTSCFLYAYALMQIPAGILVDRYGPRKVLTCAVFICALATFLFQSTTHIAPAILSRLMLGAASSVAFIAPLTLAARWFKPQYLAIASGFIQVLGCLGAIMGGAPIAYLNASMDWRQILWGAAWVGLGLALIFWLFIQDHPTDLSHGSKPSLKDLRHEATNILRNPQNRWIALAAFASWAAVGALAELWGVPFLVAFHHVSPAKAASWVTLIWIGVTVGSPLGGWWCKHSQNHRWPLAYLLMLSAITCLFVIYVADLSDPFLHLNLVLMGCAAGAQPITFSLIAQHNPKEYIGTAFGFNNMAVVCGASLLQPAIGGLLDYFWDGQFLDVPIYSITSYQAALSIVPLSILVGLFATLYCIRERPSS